MNNKNSKLTIMRDEPVKLALLKLGLPTMIGMMVSALYSVIDAYFVGGLGTSQIGAIAIAFPIVQIIIGLAMTFGSGAASYIARLLGANKYERANQTASVALFSSLVVGGASIIIALCFLEPLLKLLGATESILPYARSYAVIYIAGAILNIFNVTMNNIITAEGAAKLTMISMITGGSLNVILDPIFIYPLGFGIQGAAIATVSAQAITSLIYVWYLTRKKGTLRFSPRNFIIDRKIYGEIFKVGIPIFAFQFLASLALGMTNTASAPFGDSALAAMGVVARIITLGTYVIFGFAKGYQPLAGYNYGAKQYDRLKEATKTALLLTTIFCAVVSILMICIPGHIVSLFSKNDSSLTDVGSRALRAYGIIFTFFGFELIVSSLFLAIGYGKEGGLLSISRQGLFFIPAMIIMPQIWKLNGVIWAQPVAEALAVLLAVILILNFWGKVKNKDKLDCVSV
ncbi:MAG: MATE family efflux transporter [Spirochaetales bacterium]|nr:MATE family efflux transporter [Spirochaetales bacterium]